MAIKASDAIACARTLIGMPYSEMDCINLIKKIIRTAPGGVKGYTTAGTNTLWRSMEMSAKYRDLTWRQDGLTGARAGMLAFKADGEDVHHVGILTGEGTVIHASSAAGETVETPLDAGWSYLAKHRHIDTMEEKAHMSQANGVVRTRGGRLNVRNAPWGEVIGTLSNGSEVEVLGEDGAWLRIAYADGVGYVFAAYIEQTREEDSLSQLR